tara:strand:+ start:172 stop:1074 length:903 start_codon:yes stop_codon:yes gene_type:complete
MNIHLENVNLQSTSGPNHFASKLIKYIDATFDPTIAPDARLCFIESHRSTFDDVPLFQRLDGIYFNTAQDYKLQNTNIKRTYDNADGVIFQSNFNKQLITKYFGEHKNHTVIHNGADVEYIDKVPPLKNSELDKHENVWCCAASWRPHKRLSENIKYFLEYSSEKDCLVIAGNKNEDVIENNRIFYAGNISVLQLISLYKRSKYFMHLAWLDHCPNVVVDARAADCQIICSSEGGTKEIAGPDAIIIEEDTWDFEPVELYNPPPLDFSKKVKNNHNIDYNIHMSSVSTQYRNFIDKAILK